MKTLMKKAGGHVAPALLALLGSTSSWAAATCSQSVATVTVSPPTSITVPRDAANGASLTGWFSSEAVTDWYTCIATAATGTGTGFQMLRPSAGQTTAVEGVTYEVFATGVDGIGVIVSARTYANGCGWEPFAPVNANWTGWGCNSQGTVTNGGQLRAMFVKTGPIPAGYVPPTLFAVAASVSNVFTTNLVPDPALQIRFVTTGLNVTSLACATPDVDVYLGSHRSSIFTGINSASPAATFDISLNNCPAGLSAIHYQIDAVTSVVDAANAVVNLDASSSAAGVGVQLLDGEGNPLPLGTKRPLTGYNGATGGSFKIPLRARYRQTAGTITPGSANTAMTFTIDYL